MFTYQQDFKPFTLHSYVISKYQKSIEWIGSPLLYELYIELIVEFSIIGKVERTSNRFKFQNGVLNASLSSTNSFFCAATIDGLKNNHQDGKN